MNSSNSTENNWWFCLDAWEKAFWMNRAQVALKGWRRTAPSVSDVVEYAYPRRWQLAATRGGGVQQRQPLARCGHCSGFRHREADTGDTVCLNCARRDYAADSGNSRRELIIMGQRPNADG